MGSSWYTHTGMNAQSSKRVVLSFTTSDKDRSRRAVVVPTLSTNRYCQRFSPETLLHFLKGKDESGLKRRLKCWSAQGGSSGDCEWEGGVGVHGEERSAMFHILTMFESKIFVCPYLIRNWFSCVHMVYTVLQLWLSIFNQQMLGLSTHFLSNCWEDW